jgi:hypothetical protein
MNRDVANVSKSDRSTRARISLVTALLPRRSQFLTVFPRWI